jgi:hypothetical protein
MDVKTKNIIDPSIIQVASLCLIAGTFVALVSLEGSAARFGVGGIAGGLGIASALLLAAFALYIPAGSIRRNAKRILLLLALIHLLSTFLFFPPDGIVNGRPVYTLDHPIHYYQVETTRRVFWKHLRLDFYDPYFMAGYPAGSLFDLDTKGAELFAALLPFVNAARALKLFIILAYLSIPFTVYGASRMLGLAVEESILATVFALVFWHNGRPYASDFRFAGMFAFIFTSHLCLYLVGLFKRFIERRGSLPFFIVGPVAFLIHPTAAVILPVPFVATAAAARGRIDGKLIARFLAWCGLVIVVNSIWLVPMFRFMGFKTPSQTYFQLGGVVDALRIVLRPECLPAVALIVASIAGMVMLVRSGRHEAALPCATGGLALFLAAAYGLRVPGLDQMEPGRFLLSMFFFLAPPAGVPAAALLGSLARRGSAMRVAAVVVFWTALLSPLWFSFASSKIRHKHQITTVMPVYARELVEVLAKRVDAGGRLMIEDGPAALYGNGHLPGMLPLLTGVEQIGGPYPHTFLAHHYAAFQSDRAFGKPLGADGSGLADEIRRYDVHWIVSATAKTEELLSRTPGLEITWASPRYKLWRVSTPSGWSDHGFVKVRARIDRLEVEMEGAPEQVVLKYHWSDRLLAESPAEIFPVPAGEDPVPFIGMKPHGAERVVIHYR